MDFQIDFGNALAPAPTDATPLLASVEGIAHTLGPEECVFEDRSCGAIHVMTVQVVQALELCRPFRAMDQHVAAVAAALPGMGAQLPAVRRVLEQMVERGLLRESGAWIATLGREAAPVQGELGPVFVRACDRPAQLEAPARTGEGDQAAGAPDSRGASEFRRHPAVAPLLNDAGRRRS